MKTLHDLFLEAAERFSAQPALSEPLDNGSIATLTFQEVRERLQSFAGFLQEQGITKGDRILLWSASRSDWMVAYLGSLLAGAIVVPLDINTREDFLQRLIQTTEARMLIGTKKLVANLKEQALPFIDIEALPSGKLQPAQLPTVEPDELAELVFTSGTTGQPKGVMLSHANIVSNVLAAVQAVHISSDDRLLSILPLSHMFELTIEIALLHMGASVVYARSLAPDTLFKLLGSQRITCVVLVPQALQLFMNGIEREVRRQKKERQWDLLHKIARFTPFSWRRRLFGSVHQRFGGHFRFFVSGGAYLPPNLARRWEEMGFRVLQGYGATECSPIISATPFNEHTYDSVGKSIPGVEIRLASDGEVMVKGPNVAKGYWKSLEATAAAFQDGWYATGDLAEFDARGHLHLKGRKKNLIVLANGLNVYPEDIENILTSHPHVKDAVVLDLHDPGQDPQVHGVLLLEEPSQAKAVVQATNKQLAPHQQLRGFTVWPEQDFPRTHTLKVKRVELIDALQEQRKQQNAKEHA